MHEFLSHTDWAAAQHAPLAGDASARKYLRLTHSNTSAILMDAGPDAATEINRFKLIAAHLKSLGLSAPTIIATDDTRFMLIEDLGDAVFSNLIAADASLETPLYLRAADALIAMHQSAPPSIAASYGPDEMTTAIEMLFDWYPKLSGLPVSEMARHSFKTNLQALLAKHLTAPAVFIHRDYHAENLIWLPEREGAKAVGLLDFQDAVSGDPAYDLASLLYDARRDVSQATQNAVIAHFTAKTGVETDTFGTAFALCSAQRNMRIIGIFTRLSVQFGKRHYADLMPRVWRDLTIALDHRELTQIKHQFDELFTAPTPSIIEKIKTAHAR